MSEANVPPRHESSGHSDAGSAPPPAAQGHQPQNWTPVPLPGTVPLADMPSAAPNATPRESELLNLIRDLNRCNEALMARVNQLESALEQSQQTLHREREKARQHPQPSPADKAAMAQQRSMAQLLSELETANDSLKRQRILSETLQAQLDTSQERVTQLDRECTVLRQRQGDHTQALEKAEALCRDLRSRLQRQQRYTLQFKAALEKCLDMNAQGTVTPIPNNVVMEAPYSSNEDANGNPLSMPRADRIQPWSSGTGANDVGTLDPHLMALLRKPSAAPASDPGTAPATRGEADVHLWQDLERVIDHATAAPDGEEDAIEVAAPSEDQGQRLVPEPEATFTEPSPWGPPQPRHPSPEAPATSHGEETPFPSTVPTDPVPTWSSPTPTEASFPDDASAPQSASSELPVFKMAGQQGPSPLVHPLRPQKKKRTSLSAVELPSFPPLPKAPAGH